MNIKKLGRICCLLLIFLITACQGTTPTLTPLVTPPIPLPTSTVAPYPLPNLLDQPYPIVPNPPTLDPTLAAELSLTPSFLTDTSTPDHFILTQLPNNSESRQYFHPECDQEDPYLQCVDPLIGMNFRYLVDWGMINAMLMNGNCGGLYYGYQFEETEFAIEAGGTSWDFCHQMGGSLFSLFKGFALGEGCSKFFYAQDCETIQNQVVIATMFPEFDMLCAPGPGSFFTPLMVVGINLPSDRTVGGLAFSFDFLSESGKEQLFAPFEGDPQYSEKCSDAQAEETYNQLVEEISWNVKQGTFDELTTSTVNQIINFANSISFTP